MNPKCPLCKNELQPVLQERGSVLNEDQFAAVRAGDYYCTRCPDNGRGNTGYRYFWARELAPSAVSLVRKYRKKPVVIEAIQVGPMSIDACVEFCQGKMKSHPLAGCVIETLEGNMTVNIGDYIIKGVKGEFYPCRNDIFLATYDEA